MDGEDTRSDQDLLTAFVNDGCEKAFTAIVHRHIGLVYSAALQKVRNSHLAEDVSQAVFVLLARKAAQLRPGTILSGWLYRTARFTANDLVKAEERRHRREELAEATNGASEESERWAEAARHLDQALAGLSEKDRLTILLRFFEEKSIGEVGKVLGIGEEAARKRIDRSVEKLRRLLPAKNGVVTPTDLTDLIRASAKPKLPEGAAIRAATAALAGTTGLQSSVLELVRLALQTMLVTRIKRILAISSGLTILLVLAFQLSNKPIPIENANNVIERHLAAANVRSFRTACSSCHRNDRFEPDRSGPGICLRGQWQDLQKALQGTFEIQIAGPERVLEEIAFGTQTQLRGRNKNVAWIATDTKETRFLSEPETAQFRRDTTFLLWPQRKQNPNLAYPAWFNRQHCYRLQVRGPAEYFFDVASGLFVGTVWKADGEQCTNTLSDYRDFQGFLAPSRILLSRKGTNQLLLVESVTPRDFPLHIFDPPSQLRTASRAVQ